MSPEELADRRADIERAIACGEMFRVERPARTAPACRAPAPPPDALVRQYWRWAASVYPDGIPPGFTAEERP
jgi:hypothetical protein